MKKIFILLVLFLLAIPLFAQNKANIMPLGVYMGWERGYSCARAENMSHSNYINKVLNTLVDNNVEVLWVTNMLEEDLEPLLKECSKRKIKLILGMGCFEIKVDWYFNDPNYYPNKIKALKSIADKYPGTLIGWVISDEPMPNNIKRVEEVRKYFVKNDPDRFSIVVTMSQITPTIVANTSFDVYCSDPYPFFVKGNPNGPHTDNASINYFRGSVAKEYLSVSEKNNVIGWNMYQCFNEIWGPREYNSKGELIGLPGAFNNWRCPTVAEMRWQTWESLRGGLKGLFIFTIVPEAPDINTKKEPSSLSSVAVISKETYNAGYNALLTPNAVATPQFIEIGKIYKGLKPLKKLISNWNKLDVWNVSTSNKTISIGIFEEDKNTYFIVVNDDLNKTQKTDVIINQKASKVLDMINNETYIIKKDKITTELKAGDGKIFKIIK